MKSPFQFRPQCESLGDRTMPSITLSGGVLDVEGTAAADVIDVRLADASHVRVTVNTTAEDQTFLLSEVESVHIHGRAGNDVIRVAPDVMISADIAGNRGDDIIRGGGAADVLHGNLGNDIISGRGGNDRIFGDEGNDSLDGGRGNDLVRAGLGDDYVTGGVGNDRLFGDDGNDVVLGLNGDDSIHGGSGSNVLDGGEGSDDVRDGADDHGGGDDPFPHG